MFDEGTVAHYVTLSKDGYEIDNSPVVLRSSDGELDAEAAATDGKFYYVTGSHSVKRSSCKNNPDSRRLIRFGHDANGKATMSGGKLVDYIDTDAVWRLMATRDELKQSVGDRMCLGTEPHPEAPALKGRRGVNIEGLAARDGRLHFGFRGPTSGGAAPILSVDAQAIFADALPPATITMLRVGEGRAIRDMTVIADGVLVLAGPDDDDANADRGWVVIPWDGKPRDGGTVDPKGVVELDLSNVKLRDCDKEVKPEAIAVLADGKDRLDLVIMSDGMCDGGPLRFSIQR